MLSSFSPKNFLYEARQVCLACLAFFRVWFELVEWIACFFWPFENLKNKLLLWYSKLKISKLSPNTHTRTVKHISRYLFWQSPLSTSLDLSPEKHHNTCRVAKPIVRRNSQFAIVFCATEAKTNERVLNLILATIPGLSRS